MPRPPSREPHHNALSRRLAFWTLAACSVALLACDGDDAAGDGGALLDATRADAATLKDGSSTSDAAIEDVTAPVDVPIAPPTGTVRDVEHVVIFMQENRSFDSYFGALAGVRGFGDPTPQMLHSGQSVFVQPNDGVAVMPFHLTLDCESDIDHGWPSGHVAWHGGQWDRWVAAKGFAALAFHDRRELPYYYALADAYTVLDNFHCSVMGPTNPNRLYLMSGTIDPMSSGGGPVTDNTEPAAGFTWTTYPERLQAAGVSWRVYQTLDNFDDNALAWFRAYKQSHEGDALYDRGILRTLDLVGEFRRDVVSGALPKVSWIIAPTALSEHPPYSLASGQHLTRQLLDALHSNPAVARSTAFILTYDENGGFYDHVPPPTPPAGTAHEFVADAPIGFGNRVPMIIVSPWTRGGVIDSEVADLTSILRFLEAITGVREPNISPWRRQVASDLMAAFDFAHPDYTLPTLPATSQRTCASTSPSLPPMQVMPTQEPGVRPTRALPYQPEASSRTSCSEGRFYIAMTNTGSASVHFQVNTNRFRTDGPWHYDVMPGATVEDFFSVVTYGGGRYDLTLSSPNGFERQYAGDLNVACDQLEVSSTLHPSDGTIELRYTNRGASTVTFTTRSTRYRSDGPWTNTVTAGASDTRTLNIAEMGARWYSLDVTASGDSTFRRRFAGHMENGQPGVTGS